MIEEGKTEGWLRLPINTLQPWATFNNVSLNGIKVGPQPGHEDRGSTVIACQELHATDAAPLMIVPRDLVLSLERVQEHAKTDKDFRAVLEALGEFGRNPRGAILSFLLMQNFIACPSTTGKRGVTSPFTEYIKFLPLELLPTFWTEAERELLTGTTLYSAVNAKLKSLYREFENLRSATSKISWCAESWWDEIDGLISFDDWLQVDAMYRSRALEFPGIGDCMAPCIDMANHSSGDATMAIYEVDNDGNALLLLREGKDVRINDEITITYGDNKGACEMLFSYGFIEDEMESAKELFLHLPLPEDDPLARAKAAVADTAPGFKVFEHGQVIDWEGDYVWLLCVNEEDGLEFKVQRTIDGDREIKAFWKEEVLSEVKAFKSLLQADPMWEVFHLRAVSLLQDRVASQLQALYGSEDEVNATPHGEGTSIRDRPWHLSQRLRTLEAGLLEKAYAHFEDLKLELAQSKTVRTYLGADDEDIQEDFS